MRLLTHSVLVQLIIGALLKAFAPASWGLENILQLSALSVIGLFLMVGLHIQLKKFSNDLWLCLRLVIVTTFIPMVCFYFTGKWFDLENTAALTLSVILVTTGTGVTIQTLSNQGMLHTRVGQFLTLVSALDDIPATIFMAWLLFDVPGSNLNISGVQGLYFGLALGSFLLVKLLRTKSFRHKEWVLSFVFILFAVFFAYSLEGFHVSLVMGGLFAGFILSLAFSDVTELTRIPIEKILRPVLPFYMVYIGMKLSPGILLEKDKLIFSATLIVIAIATKWICTYFLMRKRTELRPMVIAWGMVPRGIPGFAFASVAVAGGLISSELFTILVLIVSVSTWIGLLGLEISLKSSKQT